MILTVCQSVVSIHNARFDKEKPCSYFTLVQNTNSCIDKCDGDTTCYQNCIGGWPGVSESADATATTGAATTGAATTASATLSGPIGPLTPSSRPGASSITEASATTTSQVPSAVTSAVASVTTSATTAPSSAASSAVSAATSSVISSFSSAASSVVSAQSSAISSAVSAASSSAAASTAPSSTPSPSSATSLVPAVGITLISVGLALFAL
ncbi:unnamed protein product [Rhizopus microsporus]